MESLGWVGIATICIFAVVFFGGLAQIHVLIYTGFVKIVAKIFSTESTSEEDIHCRFGLHGWKYMKNAPQRFGYVCGGEYACSVCSRQMIEYLEY